MKYMRSFGVILFMILFAAAAPAARLQGHLPWCGALHPEEFTPPQETYILLVNDSGMDWFAWKAALEAAGIHPRHFFPPDAAIVAQETSVKGLQGTPGVPTTVYEQIADAEVEALSARSTPLRAASNALAHLQGRDLSLQEEPGMPLINDALAPPPDALRSICSAATLHLNPAEYMLGSVTVTVIFPESTGMGTENWTTTYETNVTNGITQGLNDLSLTYYNRIAFTRPTWTMVYILGRTTAAAQVSVEPISNAHPDDSNPQWINTIYTALGYSESTSVEKGRHFNGHQREAQGTKWAYNVFVANSVADGDGLFSDGWFGYAYLGGPYEVMTYDNDGWGIGQMNKVHRHEGSHIFYALDEYSASGCACADTSGYVTYQDQNCNASCPSNVNCIMHEAANQINVCSYTGGMIGWGDTDSDTIPDPVDIEPITTLTAYTPDPTTNPNLTYTGNAQIQKKTNQNVWNYHCDYNILNLANVQYRVDGGSWTSATASDGSFNSANENYTFTITLANGTHTIETRAVDDVGQVDSTPASDSVTVNATSAPKPVPDGRLSGTAMRGTRMTTNGSTIRVTYDTSTCTMADHSILYGNFTAFSTLNPTGGVCSIGNTSPYNGWTTVPTGYDVWWVVVGDGGTVESSWGQKYTGGAYSERRITASSQCGNTTINTTGTCP
jgi:hypothetical protein